MAKKYNKTGLPSLIKLDSGTDCPSNVSTVNAGPVVPTRCPVGGIGTGVGVGIEVGVGVGMGVGVGGTVGVRAGADGIRVAFGDGAAVASGGVAFHGDPTPDGVVVGSTIGVGVCEGFGSREVGVEAGSGAVVGIMGVTVSVGVDALTDGEGSGAVGLGVSVEVGDAGVATGSVPVPLHAANNTPISTNNTPKAMV